MWCVTWKAFTEEVNRAIAFHQKAATACSNKKTYTMHLELTKWEHHIQIVKFHLGRRGRQEHLGQSSGVLNNQVCNYIYFTILMLNIFMYECFACMKICGAYVCLVPIQVREVLDPWHSYWISIRSHWISGTELQCMPPFGWWESNPCPLNTELSLHPQLIFSYRCCKIFLFKIDV